MLTADYALALLRVVKLARLCGLIATAAVVAGCATASAPQHSAVWWKGYHYAQNHQTDFYTYGGPADFWCTGKADSFQPGNASGTWADEWGSGCMAALKKTG